MAPLEGLCAEAEARWFYWGWSRVYDVMQPFFTSDEMAVRLSGCLYVDMLCQREARSPSSQR